MSGRLVELDPSEIGGLVSIRWAGQPGMRWFLLDPIDPPPPPWRRRLTGSETCAGCGRTNEDDALRPTRREGVLACSVECQRKAERAPRRAKRALTGGGRDG